MTLNQFLLLGMFACCINMGIALREGRFGSFALNAFVLLVLSCLAMNNLWLCRVKHRWKLFNGSDNPLIRCRKCLRCDTELYTRYK